MNVSYNVEGPSEPPIPDQYGPSGPQEQPATGASSPLPIILIHGFAEDSTIWGNQVAYLKNSHQLLVPDLPGSGQSALLTGPTSMEELAETIKAILDAENITACIMIGHSMGGYIALAFAEKYPDSINALGLFHSTAYPDTAEKKQHAEKALISSAGMAPGNLSVNPPPIFSLKNRKMKTCRMTVSN